MTEDELKALPPEAGEVEIVTTAAPAPDAVASDDEAAKRLREQMKALQDTAAAERQGRLDADARSRQHAEEVKRYQSQAISAEVSAIETALESATRARQLAEQEYQAAMEAGEYRKAAEAQSKQSEASAEIVQLRRDKAAGEASVTKSETTEGRVEPQSRSYVDPVEEFIARASPKSQAWLRQHRDLVLRAPNGQPYLAPRLIAAHTLAIDEAELESPEYFAAIENIMRPRSANSQQEQRVSDEPEPRSDKPKLRPTQVAAPPSRDVPSSNGQTQRTRIQLTKEQVEAAHLFGDPKKSEREREIEYWNNLKALEAEGKMGMRH